jgi:hypothetical protein
VRRFTPDQLLAVMALASVLAVIILLREWLRF